MYLSGKWTIHFGSTRYIMSLSYELFKLIKWIVKKKLNPVKASLIIQFCNKIIIANNKVPRGKSKNTGCLIRLDFEINNE